MIEKLKIIEQALVSSQEAMSPIDILIQDIDEKFLLIDECFGNNFILQRITIDYLKSHTAKFNYQNERLRYLAKKLIDNPKLLESDISTSIIDELCLIDAALQDGELGRPVMGFISPKNARQILEIFQDPTVDLDIKTWSEWEQYFINCQLKIKQLIVLFPIQYDISSNLFALYHGITQINKEVSQQKKLEITIKALAKDDNDNQFSEHAAYFRLHISSLQRKILFPPEITPAASNSNACDPLDTSTNKDKQAWKSLVRQAKQNLDLEKNTDMSEVEKNERFQEWAEKLDSLDRRLPLLSIAQRDELKEQANKRLEELNEEIDRRLALEHPEDYEKVRKAMDEEDMERIKEFSRKYEGNPPLTQDYWDQPTNERNGWLYDTLMRVIRGEESLESIYTDASIRVLRGEESWESFIRRVLEDLA